MSRRSFVLSSPGPSTPSSWRAFSSSCMSRDERRPSETASFTLSRYSCFFLSPPNQSLMLIASVLSAPGPHPLFAGEFDFLGGRLERLSERDETVAAKDRFLAAQNHFRVSVHVHERAVRAAVRDHELALAHLDLAVGAGSHLVR